MLVEQLRQMGVSLLTRLVDFAYHRVEELRRAADPYTFTYLASVTPDKEGYALNEAGEANVTIDRADGRVEDFISCCAPNGFLLTELRCNAERNELLGSVPDELFRPQVLPPRLFHFCDFKRGDTLRVKFRRISGLPERAPFHAVFKLRTLPPM